MADYSGGPSYYEMTHVPTADELEVQAKAARKREAFPHVGYDAGQEVWVHEWALRRKKDGKIVTKLEGDGPYHFDPMGSCPEGYELVSRTLWPEPWEAQFG